MKQICSLCLLKRRQSFSVLQQDFEQFAACNCGYHPQTTLMLASLRSTSNCVESVSCGMGHKQNILQRLTKSSPGRVPPGPDAPRLNPRGSPPVTPIPCLHPDQIHCTGSLHIHEASGCLFPAGQLQLECSKGPMPVTQRLMSERYAALMGPL